MHRKRGCKKSPDRKKEKNIENTMVSMSVNEKDKERKTQKIEFF